MALSDTINVSITRNTTAADRATFATPIFISEEANLPTGVGEDFENTRVQTYTEIESMTDGGFTTSDNAYKAAQQFFAQNPRVKEFKVGKKETGDADWPTAIVEVSKEDDNWYALLTEVHTTSEVLAIAAAVEALPKIYFVGNADDTNSLASLNDPAAAGDTLGKLFDNNYTRTISFYHHEADSKFTEAAFAGYNLPFQAGKATWNLLQLNGVPAAQNGSGQLLTETELDNLQARNANTVVTLAGVDATVEGKVAEGEWIDVIRGIDALDEDMTKSLLDLLLNQQGGKVPYTNRGLNQIRNVMENVLDRFVRSGFIQENYTINIPDAADIAIVDKQNRVLNNVSFEAFLQGAIHSIQIGGNVTYEGT